MLYMVIEDFRDGDDEPVYRRLRISRWEDLVEFEVIPVMSSSDAAALVSQRLK